MQARRGELVDVLAGPGLVAVAGGRSAGLATWSAADESTSGLGEGVELRALVVSPQARGRGIARRLLEATHDRLRAEGHRRLWVVTTNDNLAALALYQKLGYRLSVLRSGAVEELRRTIKPSITETGADGIPIRDELELTRDL